MRYTIKPQGRYKMVKTLGEIINEYRKTHKMSMDDFANKSELSKAYISMLEKNYNPKSKKKIIPTIDTIAKCAKAMNMDFDELFNALGTQTISTSLVPVNESSNIINIPLYKPNETILDLFKQHREYSHCALPMDKLNPSREYFGTIARFDNNIDVGIRKDDYLIFEKTDTLKNGQLGCYVYNEYFYIGRYYQYGQDIIVVFASEKYQPIYANEISRFQILGRLCTVITSYNE